MVLLPEFPALFAGVRALGSTPRRLVTLLRASGLRRGDRVLDLACGKGAVGVSLAEHLGARVVGVDACAAFLNEARSHAHQRGVQRFCEWREEDARAFVRNSRVRFDVSLMIGLWPLDQAAKALRRVTRPGGLYVIDDAVRDHRHPRGSARGAYRDVPDVDACGRIIDELGDAVVRRVMIPVSAMVSQNRAILQRLARNSAAIARRRPALRRVLDAFIRDQQRAGVELEGALRPTIFVIRRSRS